MTSTGLRCNGGLDRRDMASTSHLIGVSARNVPASFYGPARGSLSEQGASRLRQIVAAPVEFACSAWRSDRGTIVSYTLVLVMQDTRRGLSADTAKKALSYIDTLTSMGYAIVTILDDAAWHLTIDDLRRFAIKKLRRAGRPAAGKETIGAGLIAAGRCRMDVTDTDPPQLSGVRVLVVEYELLLAVVLIDAVEARGGIALGPVLSVAEALTAIADELIDAAILNVDLRGQQSGPMAKALASRKIPFLFVTGNDAFVHEHYPNVPVHPKPYEMPKIVAALALLLSR